MLADFVNLSCLWLAIVCDNLRGLRVRVAISLVMGR